MKKTLGFIGGALALICMSAASYADSVPESHFGSIVMLSNEESEIPGYFHQKYVYNHPDCLGSVAVDYYGPAIDITDVNVLAKEQKMCGQNFWGRDGSGSEGGGD
jgi:hypothetical protein